MTKAQISKLQILFVMGSLYQRSSGPYWSLRDTAIGLQKSGHEVTIVGSKDNWRQEKPEEWDFSRAFAFNKVGPYSLHFTPGLKGWLKKKETIFDVAGFQSVWQYNNYIVSQWCLEKRVPYLITAHGNFNPEALKISVWKKRLARAWFVDRMLKHARCFQALTEDEYNCIRRFGLKQPVCLIPNGIKLPPDCDLKPTLSHQPDLNGKMICLYLGRLHEIKNLVSLIDAWAGIEKRFREKWVLALVGPDEGDHKLHLERQVLMHKLDREVLFVGPQYGDAKALWLRNASFLVLPSISEGFPMTLLEAMSYKLPILYTKACNFKEAGVAGAGIETGTSIQEIRDGLVTMLSKTDEERKEIGRRGYKLVSGKYQWEHIVQELVRVYQWMTGRGEPPASVLFD